MRESRVPARSSVFSSCLPPSAFPLHRHRRCPIPRRTPLCTTERPRNPSWGVLSFYFDNDVFTGNDNKYTGGLGFSWTSAAAETYRETGLSAQDRERLLFPAHGERGGLPELSCSSGWAWRRTRPPTSESPDPPPGDHPYAGVIYVDSSLFSMSRIASHQLTLRLGLVGPATGAEDDSEMDPRDHRVADPAGLGHTAQERADREPLLPVQPQAR